MNENPSARRASRSANSSPFVEPYTSIAQSENDGGTFGKRSGRTSISRASAIVATKTQTPRRTRVMVLFT